VLKRVFSLCCLMSLLLLFAACGNASTFSTDGTPIDTPTATPQLNTLPVSTAIGKFQEYALPQSNSGLMRPAIDHKGRLWFGEMGHNALAVFDTHTHTFQQMTPPQGNSGIMGVVVAPDDTIWFCEQYANYIGHYFPDTQHYQIYTLPTLTIPDPGDKNKTISLPSAPNDLALDQHGNVWFTELNSDSLGMLNTTTGLFTHYPLSAKKTVQTLDPYGIAIDPKGFVWFTEASNNHLGRLDPTTGNIRIFSIRDSKNSLMEVISDAHGIIWATAFNNGLLVCFDPVTEQFTYYNTPSTGARNGSGGLYGVVATPDGELWVTVPAENVIAQLDTNARRFVYYRIPTASSLPLGIVIGPNNTLWFTEAGSSKIGILTP
jgi:virginiamycin B lyase